MRTTVLANIEVGISVCGHLISSYSFAVFPICRLSNCTSVILSRELPSLARILSSEVKNLFILHLLLIFKFLNVKYLAMHNVEMHSYILDKCNQQVNKWFVRLY